MPGLGHRQPMKLAPYPPLCPARSKERMLSLASPGYGLPTPAFLGPLAVLLALAAFLACAVALALRRASRRVRPSLLVGLLVALLAGVPATPGPAPAPKTVWVEANVKLDFAEYLALLGGKVQMLRRHRGEPFARAPGIGVMAAALGHVHGFPNYPDDPKDRQTMEDLLTALEQDPQRAHEVPAMRERMVAHYLRQSNAKAQGGGARG